MSIAVCISTVNEVETIAELVGHFHARDCDVIVVDGNSKDGTWQAASEAGATVNVLAHPMGIKTHLLTGWRMAIERGAEQIIQIDAGGSHDWHDALRMLQAQRKHRADLVIGSRYCHGALYRGNAKRKYLSRFAAWMCRMKTGAPYTDWTSGYRVYTADMARELLRYEPTYQANMHAFQIETLNTARELGAVVVDVPITYTAGRSSFNTDAAREALKVWVTL